MQAVDGSDKNIFCFFLQLCSQFFKGNGSVFIQKSFRVIKLRLYQQAEIQYRIDFGSIYLLKSHFAIYDIIQERKILLTAFAFRHPDNGFYKLVVMNTPDYRT